MTKIDLPADNSKDFAAAIMQKIESEHIIAHSRLWFVLHDVAFWCLWFLSALIGAFALSAIVFVLQSSMWQLYQITHDSFLSYATNTIPFIWLFLFAVMCILAHVNLRHTPKGYRYSSGLLIILNLTVTLLVAVIVTVAGLGKFIDEEVGKHVPLYVPAAHKQELQWFKPHEGLLIGKVVYADKLAHVFVLQSPEADEIDVDGHLLTEQDWQLLTIPAIHVRVIGVPQESDPAPFVACVILPVLMPAGSAPLKFDYAERIMLEPRSIECKGVRPYDRFDQIKHW